MLLYGCIVIALGAVSIVASLASIRAARRARRERSLGTQAFIAGDLEVGNQHRDRDLALGDRARRHAILGFTLGAAASAMQVGRLLAERLSP